MLTINPDRPMEELEARNRRAVRDRLGCTDCRLPARDQLRRARPTRRTMRKASPALRRGWALAALQIIAENRTLFARVTLANPAIPDLHLSRR